MNFVHRWIASSFHLEEPSGLNCGMTRKKHRCLQPCEWLKHAHLFDESAIWVVNSRGINAKKVFKAAVGEGVCCAEDLHEIESTVVRSAKFEVDELYRAIRAQHDIVCIHAAVAKRHLWVVLLHSYSHIVNLGCDHIDVRHTLGHQLWPTVCNVHHLIDLSPQGWNALSEERRRGKLVTSSEYICNRSEQPEVAFVDISLRKGAPRKTIHDKTSFAEEVDLRANAKLPS